MAPALRARFDQIDAALAALVAAPPPRSAEDAVVFAIEESDEPDDVARIAVDPEHVTAAMASALTTVVAREVRSALNTLRGRVD